VAGAPTPADDFHTVGDGIVEDTVGGILKTAAFEDSQE